MNNRILIGVNDIDIIEFHFSCPSYKLYVYAHISTGLNLQKDNPGISYCRAA